MKFKPRGNWLAVRVNPRPKWDRDKDGSILVTTGSWQFTPYQDLASGRITDLGDFADAGYKPGIQVGKEVVFQYSDAMPTFTDGEDTIRFIQIDDIIATTQE